MTDREVATFDNISTSDRSLPRIIDYAGETLEEAIGEINAYLAGKHGERPMLNVSLLACDGPILVWAWQAGSERGLADAS